MSALLQSPKTSPAAIASRQSSHARAASVRPHRAPRNRPASSRAGSRTRIGLAEAGRALEPVGADRRKALPAVPLREAVAAWPPPGGQQDAAGATTGAGGREIGRRIRAYRPDGCTQLTPMPIATAKPARSRPRSGCRRASPRSSSRSFGHFTLQTRSQAAAHASATASCTASAGDERQLRRARRRRRIGQAAAWRRDCPAATPRRCRAGRARRSGCCAVIHSGPRSPARASASASALVEPSVS